MWSLEALWSLWSLQAVYRNFRWNSAHHVTTTMIGSRAPALHPPRPLTHGSRARLSRPPVAPASHVPAAMPRLPHATPPTCHATASHMPAPPPSCPLSLPEQPDTATRPPSRVACRKSGTQDRAQTELQGLALNTAINAKMQGRL
jgi:hypothetical protein